MNEVNYILNTMSDRSLIIIDELCRSTSVEEGTAIAMMICETLAKSKAYTFITTHFTLLTKLADLFFNVKVWQLQTIPSGNPNDPKAMKLDFKFSLIPGVTTLRGYGVYMVRGIWPDDVLKLVDELQEQHTKQLQDPKFPTIDKRVRLKYELDCQVKKLKLQKKFTLANLNMHVNHFYSEMQKLGGDHDQYSQNIMQQLQETADDTPAGLDHSIFDASQSSNNCLVEELSKIGLENVSSSLVEVNGDTAMQLNEEHIVFSSTTSQGSMQIASLSEARKRMEEVFTPNTQLDISQATSWSINLSQRFEPEINLSYAASSQCSLNFTQDALQDGEIQRENNGVLENPHNSINIFEGYGNIEEEIPVSQLSSRGLSQKMEDIRKQEELATIVEKTSMPPPHTNWISAPLNPSSVAESPFIGTFARPLQADARKTSTPLITMVKYDTINVGTSASTSMISERDLNVTRITTPRVCFTVPRNMENLDIASVVEELESLADALEEDEEQNIIRPVVKNLQVDDNNVLVEAFNSLSNCQESKFKTTEEQNITRPIVKNLQTDDNNALVEAFNSLSNCKEPQSITEEQNIMRPIVKNLQIDDNNALIEAFNSLSNCKKPQSTTENIPNCEQIDVETNAAPETDEDIYETALSSEDTSCCYSPLTGEYQDKEDNVQTEIANKENASHNTTNDEKYEEPIALDEKTKETERIEEVIEISSDDDTQQANYVGDQIDKNDSKCNLNRSNESYKTDFDRSTEKFVNSQSQKSIDDEITEKTVDVQHKNITQCTVENVVEKSQQNESANCDVVTVLEEPVVETVNDIVEDIPMPKDKDDKSKQQLEELELTVHTNDCTKKDQEVVLEKDKTFVDIIHSATEDCEDSTVLPIEKPNENNLQVSEKPLPEKCSETSLNRRMKRKAKASSNHTPTGHEIRKKIKTQTDYKPLSESSSSNSAENKQKTRETTTSVSEASKLRNLDGVSTSTSNERSGDSQGEGTVTGLSDASRKRNLDKESTTTSSTDKAISKGTPSVSDGSSPSTSKAVNKSQQKKKTKKFIAPLKKKKYNPTTSKDDTVKKPKPSFVDPSKMSQKAIRQVFFEQDKKFYESSGSSSELAKLWEERLSRPRPTPKQIQQSTCLATIRKTNDGIEVIPAEKKKPRASKKQQKILSSFSSASMNMNIFSDENAETFDQFIKSDNKDYKSFNFKFGYGGTTKKNDDGNGKMFDFRQVNTVSSEYTSNSQSWTFVRKRSDEFNPFTLPSQASTSLPPLLTPNDFSLTPEGFYKQNRDDINGLLQKYQ